MPSPFPGMDPYLEAHWGDVHTSLTLYARDQIQPQLPGDLRARVEEYLSVESQQVISEPRTLRSIRIIDTQFGNRIVTAIAFLGRNKRRQYRAKRKDLIDGRANVVEIDLTRQGRYLLAAPPGRVPPRYRTPFRACVLRAAHPGRVELYRMPLSSRLPRIRIPLRAEDKDVTLNLQELIGRAWQFGSYDDIDYTVDADPPLRGADAAWAETLLKSKGLRK